MVATAALPATPHPVPGHGPGWGGSPMGRATRPAPPPSGRTHQRAATPPGPGAPLMDWPTIERLAREGVASGGHAATRPDLTRVGPDRLLDEMRRSRIALKDRLGIGTAGFAYPFGTVDSLVRNAAEAAGYAA